MKELTDAEKAALQKAALIIDPGTTEFWEDVERRLELQVEPRQTRENS